MEIVKSQSENIDQTKDLDLVNENYIKSERNCEKMVANAQDNLSTASEEVESDRQQKNISNPVPEEDIPGIVIEKQNLYLVDLKESESSSLNVIEAEEIESPAYEVSEEKIKPQSTKSSSEVSTHNVNEKDDNMQIENDEIIKTETPETRTTTDDVHKLLNTIKLSNDDIAKEEAAKCYDDQEEMDDNDNLEETSKYDVTYSSAEDEVDDNESDGVMVLDSSDEEKERTEINKLDQSYDDEDEVEESIESNDDSDDYDDDDLMDDVVMSAAKNSNLHKLQNSSNRIAGNNISKMMRQRRKMKKAFTQLSYRCQAKKRSVKCLNLKILENIEDHVENIIKTSSDDVHDLMGIDDNDYQFSTDSLTNSEIETNSGNDNTSSNISLIKLSQETIQLESSPEKSLNIPSKNIAINVTTKNQSELLEIIPSVVGKTCTATAIVDDFNEGIEEITLTEKMQPHVDKIRETIQKSEDIHELPIKSVGGGVVIIDEQNKENFLGHNDKIKNIVELTPTKSISQSVSAICNGENNKIDLDNDAPTKIEKVVCKDVREIDESIIGLSEGNDTVLVTIELNDSDINNKSDSKSETVSVVDPNNELQHDETVKNQIENLNSNLIKNELQNFEKITTQKNEIVPDDINKGNTFEKTIPSTRKRTRCISSEDVKSNKIPAISTSTPILSLSGKTQSDDEKTKASSSSTIQEKKQFIETDVECNNVQPTNKLRAELETNFHTHDRILSEYIDRTSNDSPNNIDKHIGQLSIEIQTLNDMIKVKEIEWNNMLHLKKVKEEICFRLTRKKQVMELMAIKVGDIPNIQQRQQLHLLDSVGNVDNTTINNTLKSDIIDAGNQNNNNNSMLKIPNMNATSSALAAMVAAASSNLYNFSGNSTNTTTTSCGSTAQSILQNRANMKSSDLVKEKANTQKLHRNILPKPGSSLIAATTTTPSSLSSIVKSQQQLSGILDSSSSAPLILTSSSQNNNLQQQFHQQFPLSLSNIASGSLLNHINNNNNINNGLLHQQQPILNSYLTAAASVQQQLGELFNGHNQIQQQQNAQNLMIGRQGVFKDVKSIIADYRQRHPEQVPRRGRRMKSTNSNDISSGGLRGNGTDLSSLLNRFEGNSRPSSNDSSSHSMTNVMPSGGVGGGNVNSANVSFKDALLQIAKISGQNADRLSAAVAASSIGKSSSGGIQGSSQQQHNSFGSPYPEVTLHPVSTTNIKNESTGSLLHGILTKYPRPNTALPTATIVAPSNNPISSTSASLLHQLNQQHTTCTPTSTTNNYNSTFSPTLARLLTAPERMANSAIQNNNSHGGGSHSTITAGGSSPSVNNSYPNISAGSSGGGAGLNLSKVVGNNSEITITPVVNSPLNLHQSILQQQIQKQQQIKDVLSRSVGLTGGGGDKIKGENFMNMMDDEADDSVDRLVIDEGGDSSIGPDDQYRIAPRAIGQEFHENEVPACQGCKKQEAQFVCAGCGNQWYCSRECQVQAWDEHSELCSG